MPKSTHIAACVLALTACNMAVSGAGLNVPFVKQTGEGCGSAAVAMVMQYWVRQTPGMNAPSVATERIDRILPPSLQGLSGDALRRYLEANGFSAFAFSGEITDLRNHIGKGRPVIVCLRPGRATGELHFVVVTGIADREVTVNDPARGKSVHEPLGLFLREWKSTDGWALLAVPRAIE